MKKIIELAENLCNHWKPISGSNISDLKALSEAIEKRRALEQTPITEDWLNEHGWEKKEMYWIRVYSHDKKMWLEWYPYEERLSRYVRCVDEWDNHSEKDELTDRMHCFNLAQLLDALELCGITMED